MKESPDVQENGNKHASPRATIIVDSSALLNLAKPVPAGPHADSGITDENFLQVLPLLAKRGFKIVIPEIVSVQTAAVLKKNGTSISKRFDNRGNHFEHRKTLISFLQKAARNEWSGISIEATDQPDASDYVQKFYNALAMPENIDRGRRSDKDIKIDELINKTIMNIYEFTDRRNLGDKAIAYLIRHDYADGVRQGKVFVLTDKHDIVNDVGEKVAITSRQLNYGLSTTGLQVEMGVHPETTPEALETGWLAQMAEYRPLAGIPLHRKNFESHPFHALLTEAVQHMPPEAPVRPVISATAQEAYGESQIEKFTKRLEKMKKQGPTNTGVPR